MMRRIINALKKIDTVCGMIIGMMLGLAIGLTLAFFLVVGLLRIFTNSGDSGF